MFSLPHNQRNWLPAYTITMCTVMTILLWTRLLSRCRRTGGRVGLDDLFISIAWLFAMAWGTLIVIAAFKYGLNRHMWDIPPNLWAGGAKISWLIEVLFFFGTCFTKMSILLFYQRLVEGVCSTRFKWILWCAIGFVVAYTIVWFVFICTTCFPLEAQWRMLDPTYTETWHCASIGLQRNLSLVGGLLSVVSDLYSVLLPAILLLKIRITKSQKIGLIFLFSLGFLVVAAGAVRTYYLVRIQSDDPDKSWNGFNVFVAGIAELNLGIICACAPSLKSLFQTFMQGQSTTKNSTGSGRSWDKVKNQLGIHMKRSFRSMASKKSGDGVGSMTPGGRQPTPQDLEADFRSRDVVNFQTKY